MTIMPYLSLFICAHFGTRLRAASLILLKIKHAFYLGFDIMIARLLSAIAKSSVRSFAAHYHLLDYHLLTY